MSVQVTLRGELGDNLFQYALGRIIAAYHGLALECAPSSNTRRLPRSRRGLRRASRLYELSQYFPGAPLGLPGDHVSTPVEAFELQNSRGWDGQTLPLRSVLNNRARRQIRLDGFFQRFEYFEAHVGDIRRWFALKHVSERHPTIRTDVVLHVKRRLNFAARGWTLPLSYYDRALSTLDVIGRLYICGTDLDDDTLTHFQRYNPVHVGGSVIAQFAFMQRFDHIVLSNSTSAWWAAFLSDASCICAPRAVDSSGYAFSGFRDVDLDTHESRYTYVDVPAFASVEQTVSSNMRSARMFVTGHDLFVERAEHPLIRIECKDHDVGVVALFAKEGTLSLADLERRVSRSTLRPLLSKLIRARLITVHSRYLEP